VADIDLRRTHGLGLERARAAAEEMARDLARRFQLKGHWSGNILRFERPGVRGELAIDAKALHLTVTLGLLLKAMRGSLERAIEEELDSLFHKAADPKPARAAARKRKPSHPRKP
jgi:putative polyhydroxyalkanoate system protein